MKQYLKEKYELYLPTIIALGGFSLILYYLFISEQLTNTFDGLWHYNYYYSGGHELGTGRWLWPWLDKIQHGIHTDPVQTILVLTFYILGTVVILDIFDVCKKRLAVVFGFMMMSCVVISAALSYKYMSLAYAGAFFLSALAMELLVKLKGKYLPIVLSALSIALMMGLYQAYLGCTCLIALIYGIKLLMDTDKDIKEALTYALRFLISAILGAVLYFVLLYAHLFAFNAELNNYNGADNITIFGIITALPKTIPAAYKQFFDFLFGDLLKDNVLDKYGLPYLLIVLFAVSAIFIGTKIFKDKISKVIVFVIAIILIPLACNACTLLAPEVENVLIQASGGMELFIPIMFLLFDDLWDVNKIVRGVTVAISVLVIYGNFVQVYIDENAMWEGKNASVTMANCILSDLSSEGCLSEQNEYFFIGCPKWSPMFYTSDLFDEANAYARFGGFWLENNMMCASYEGLFNKILGSNMKISGDYYEDIAYSEYLETMPKYPNAGYFVKWDNVVIVKVSEARGE